MKRAGKSRVLLSLFNTPFAVADGTTFRTRQILRLLSKRYRTFALVVRYPDSRIEQEVLDLATFKTLPGRLLFNRLSLYLLAFFLAVRSRPDVIYMVNDGFHAGFYEFLKKFLGVPLIYECHSIISKEVAESGADQEGVRMAEERERRLFAIASYAIVLSDEAERFYHPYNPNVTTIPAIAAETGCDVAERAHRKDGVRTIGLIGPFEAERNLLELNFLYENIERFDSRLQFRVIGACNKKLEHPRIAYTGFLEGKKDFLNSVSTLDAVLVPSRRATFGPLSKIIEPMACGVPVFTTPKGATCISHLVDGQNIFISREEEIVARVNGSAFDDDLLNQVGLNAWRTIQDHYSTEVNSKKLFELVDKAILDSRKR